METIVKKIMSDLNDNKLFIEKDEEDISLYYDITDKAKRIFGENIIVFSGKLLKEFLPINKRYYKHHKNIEEEIRELKDLINKINSTPFIDLHYESIKIEFNNKKIVHIFAKGQINTH